MWRWLLDIVVCPVCRGPLTVVEASADARDAVLGHDGGPCGERYPVIDAVPRLLVGGARALLRRGRADWFERPPFGSRFAHWDARSGATGADLRLVARFDREWGAFAQVGTSEQERLYARYFDIVPPDLVGHGRLVLDAGCGAGRWAYAVQRRGTRVVAVDLGLSIEAAARNTEPTGRIGCVQADVHGVPVRDGAFDLVYSLGVLHHVEPTAGALGGLASRVRPGGALLLYLYYALDGRPAAYRALFRVADALRAVSSGLPQPALVALSAAIAAGVYLPLARTARLLRALGWRRAPDVLPLGFYADLSFETMRNDSLDRFGTRLEKRFTRAEIRKLLEDAGLRDVVVSDRPPYWHAVGRAAARSG